MKRLLSLLLALSLLASLPVVSAASDALPADAVSLVQALGILNGDGSGDLKLANNVTRAEFAKMLVAASVYKDSAATAGYALFKDVKSGHWAAGHIKICVENGWFTGYLDGTFRPGAPILFEEAATVALRLLGFTSADLTGAYPMAQISKFESLDLHNGFTTRQGQYMTRGDCAQLFANLMTTKNKEGQVYAATLGYDLDASGKLDYTSLIKTDTKGPFTLRGSLQAALSFTPKYVYRNGQSSRLDAARDYDIYYYNADMKTVWIYSDRVTGAYSAASPSTTAPTSVTVAGQTYEIETSAAAYLLSDQGTYRIGDTLTLLLGMDGAVADVVDASATSGIFYGVVRSVQTESVANAAGNYELKRTVTVFCTDGQERSYDGTGMTVLPSAAVQIDYSAAQPISLLPTRHTEGRFTLDSFGDLPLAEDVEIIDTDRYGGALRIYPDRLKGATLSAKNVLYYLADAQGQITHLILRDATGDASTYGLVFVDTLEGGVKSYEFLIDGKKVSHTGPLNVQSGAARFTYDANGQISQVTDLKRLTAPKLADRTIYAGDKNYRVLENTEIYIRHDGTYYPVTLDSVREGHKLNAYADDLNYPAGGVVRIIVADEQK